ncbi:PREDICTED: E3 ubiquitin-protein ligase RNF170-like [Amphimedon queenslandica]|uniref:E3 ubiquitin-protein ligase RNF170 n=1 Tax=Amphimedon queenslandica TaxID=400682 RepID=A0A1X7UWQ7_AMPQE|nr:PREDICTED: E3 ubiquitin-protein ligase RNF170-like [Amphimedon queenslandica]|eukprot:XP_003386546.1 PREDICTED: E3 ubiquitin-protein ligase RNF170-like [Amphimedon queenslandica]
MAAEQNECPICLAQPTEPVETNCAHGYCAKCILTYWETTWHPDACQCPCCRREINLLMPVRTNVRDRETQEKINNYNRMMLNRSIPLTSQVRDGPNILRHIFNEILSTSGLSFCSRLWIVFILLLTLAYLISPIDLLPELILGPIGFIDDIGSFIAAMMYIVILYRQDMGRR